MQPLLDRYLTAIKFWLPKKQREDIAAELAANLQSEIEDTALLQQHGSPMLVASRSLGSSSTPSLSFGGGITAAFPISR